jgi:hypothetical protein
MESMTQRHAAQQIEGRAVIGRVLSPIDGHGPFDPREVGAAARRCALSGDRTARRERYRAVDGGVRRGRAPEPLPQIEAIQSAADGELPRVGTERRGAVGGDAVGGAIRGTQGGRPTHGIGGAIERHATGKRPATRQRGIDASEGAHRERVEL